LTRLGATSALAGVKSGCLEFLLTILTDLCFHGNSVREFSGVPECAIRCGGPPCPRDNGSDAPGCTEM
jgi:hypothetical protein